MFPVIMPAACSDEELRILRGEQEVDEDRINDDMGNGDEDEDGSDDEDVRGGRSDDDVDDQVCELGQGLGVRSKHAVSSHTRLQQRVVVP